MKSLLRTPWGRALLAIQFGCELAAASPGAVSVAQGPASSAELHGSSAPSSPAESSVPAAPSGSAESSVPAAPSGSAESSVPAAPSSNAVPSSSVDAEGPAASAVVLASDESGSSPRTRVVGPTAGVQVAGYAERAVGLRSAAWSGPGKDSGFSLALSEHSLGILGSGILSGVYEDELYFGRSSEDWAYRAGVEMGFGFRHPWAPESGPYVRFGFRATFEQDASLRFGLFQIPSTTIGYQHTAQAKVFDLGFSFAPTWTGELTHQKNKASLYGPSYGLALKSFLRPMSILGDVRSHSVDTGGQVLEARLRSCLVLGWGPPKPLFRTGDPRRKLIVGRNAADATWSICAEARYVGDRVPWSSASAGSVAGGSGAVSSGAVSSSAVGAGSRTEVLTGIIFIGFGAHSALDPAP